MLLVDSLDRLAQADKSCFHAIRAELDRGDHGPARIQLDDRRRPATSGRRPGTHTYQAQRGQFVQSGTHGTASQAQLVGDNGTRERATPVQEFQQPAGRQYARVLLIGRGGGSPSAGQ
jgi:hypothetical protein